VTKTANEWRAFWRDRGERELELLLWAAWDPVDGASPDDYTKVAPRVASLLASSAGLEALTDELGRIRVDELALAPEPEADRKAAGKIADWFAAA
jgi:hypothetical protein